MKRWEFDSIEQAAKCISSWFSGTHHEQLLLKGYLESAIAVHVEESNNKVIMLLTMQRIQFLHHYKRALLRRLHLYNIERMDNASLCASLSVCPCFLDLEIVGL
ncbi:uncharacterized protein LOC114263153 [Camellia sinensis]|uniref:uncharacterized protein LOC114263153 n=1 Tax=Camellia sinensis TaxID=4442 RepID=UPI00103642BF|nr:uncharacterized protein LOC114263153 [Camellia sinensis]